MQAILTYKEDIRQRRIPDFKPVFDILSKIEWFEQFKFNERQQLVQRADIQFYEPGQPIFKQG